MDQNVIKIESNPYTKEVKYYWKNDSGEFLWKDLSESKTSPFSKSKPEYKGFFKTTIAQKAYDILDAINRDYNKRKNGLEIVVDGTEDDFEELKDVLEGSFQGSGMHCTRGPRYMLTAKEVMPQIENIYSSLEEMLTSQNDDEISKFVSKYSDAVKPEISLCVMGLYSSGKSTFINALIGKEILPSASDPETAKIYKINCDRDNWLKFTYDGVPYRIDFRDGEWNINTSPDAQIVTEIIKSISSCSNEDAMLHNALLTLNNYALSEVKKRKDRLEKLAENDQMNVEKYLETNTIEELISTRRVASYKLDDLIEIGIPFCSNTLLPIKDYKFVIFDTPGSNSEMHKEHAEILKKSLANQTNGLPIFVTNADTLDNVDNVPVIKMIENMGKALDGTSTLIVVNKADEKTKSTLKQKRERTGDLKVTLWKPEQIFFISSIISLGRKINNPEEEDSWCDPEYAELYYDNRKKFDGSDPRSLLELYKYNILPQNIEKEHLDMVKRADAEEKIFWNTGIRSIEYEIGRFGEKFALYNKCYQAEKYLGNAIEKLDRECVNTAKAIDKTQSEIEKSINDTVRELEKKLDKKCNKEKAILNTNFSTGIVGKTVEKYLNEDRIKGLIVNIMTIVGEHSSEWKERGAFKSAKNQTNYTYNVARKVSNRFSEDINSYISEVNELSDKFWKSGIRNLKDSLLKIVYESPNLSEKQKKIVEKIVMNSGEMDPSHVKELKLSSGRGMNKEGFLWIKWVTFNKEAAAKEYKKILKDNLESKNKTVIDENNKAFERWKDSLFYTLRIRLSQINPRVMELNRLLLHYQEERENLTRQLRRVNEAKREIGELISFREVE